MDFTAGLGRQWAVPTVTVDTSDPRGSSWRHGHGLRRHSARVLCGILVAIAPALVAQPGFYRHGDTWPAAMHASRTALRAAGLAAPDLEAAAQVIWHEIQNRFPIEWDWALQDGGTDAWRWLMAGDDTALEQRMLRRVVGDLAKEGAGLGLEWEALAKSDVPGRDPRGLEGYARAARQRRHLRLETVRRLAPRVVFVRKPTLRPSFFAYTEGQSDAQNERHFLPGSSLCLLEQAGGEARVRTLVDDPTGALRDPAVSWDGERVLFAWKRSLDGDDYHLYELAVGTGAVRQITRGEGVADYEGAYLPDGSVAFASTRCVQTVDCWWTEVSNLYTCDRDGRFLRRLTFDQVHSIHPTVLEDGRVIYTRWDYNDRGQIFPQALFQMNPDGTGQQEFYGNNSWFPTTIAHARGIPGTRKVLALFCGHHTAQAGKVGILDPERGRQEATGAQLVAPVRPTPAERIDAYGQDGELFQHPYPLTDTEFLAGHAPLGWAWRDGHFGLYWVHVDGRRELLVSDPRLPCTQPVPLVARRPPTARPAAVDYREAEGTCYLQDIHTGPGLAGVPRGTIRRLRVVALEFRPAGLGANYNQGPAGDALVSTPISTGNGSWDVKVVLGETPVEADGSTSFIVPARTPVYFQALDEQGRALQTMRSWVTLQPGESQACVGCHESKNSAPPVAERPTQALRQSPRPLQPFQGPPRGFSFPREVQPILDRHCTRCHNQRAAPFPATTSPELGAFEARLRQDPARVEPAFSLLADTQEDPLSKRRWSDAYLALTSTRRQDLPWDRDVFMANPEGRLVRWISPQSEPSLLPPNHAGAVTSPLLKFLEDRHAGVTLTRDELATLACWIDLLVPYSGDYEEANAWTPDEQQRFDHFRNKRLAQAELERRNIAEYLATSSEPQPPTTVGGYPPRP